MEQKETKNRSACGVMLGLIGMVKPLLGLMILAILMGCMGNLAATFITVLGGVGLGKVLGFYTDLTWQFLFTVILILAVSRGILRYAEQASNHNIAFRLLARIRSKVFASLRTLAPAKLEGSEKGNLISVLTSDIELLEVFYAHTISPIAIAGITSIFMCVFLGHYHVLLGILAAVFYVIVGVIIPVLNGRAGQKYGQQYRKKYGDLNTIVLDNLYGLDEIIQYGQQKKRLAKMEACTKELEELNRTLKKREAMQRIATDSVILLAGIVMLGASGFLFQKGMLQKGEVLIATIAMMSSFGPTAALSALSNNLNQTLASGNRVLNLLEEKPLVYDVVDGAAFEDGDIAVKNVTFSYEDRQIADANRDVKKKKEDIVLSDFSHVFSQNTIHGILGKSGCGKSTLLKLLMRFFEVSDGSIEYGTTNVNEIITTDLRNHISYVTQETFLFSDTIENNIKVAKENATREEVMEAAKKASLHDFVCSLPDGYDTVLSELGDSVSGGERQRIGIARAFLHQSNVIFLDEPTSNLDSLNEGIILQSLERESKNRTILLVSHRKSTMAIAKNVLQM